MDHLSIKSAFMGLEKYFIRGFFVCFTFGKQAFYRI